MIWDWTYVDTVDDHVDNDFDDDVDDDGDDADDVDDDVQGAGGRFHHREAQVIARPWEALGTTQGLLWLPGPCPPPLEQNNCFEKIMIGSHELMKKKKN